jgi:UDP-N-acetylmuramate dehydrogenase
MPSAGSTFKRPEKGYASRLIEEVGLKGYVHGGVMVSAKHSGFIVNHNNGTCKEVLELIDIVTDKVMKETGIKLEPEVKIIGEF